MKIWQIVKKKIGSFFDHLDSHNHITDFFFRLIEICVIGFVSIFVAIKANSIAALQLKLSEAESRPLLTVREEQVTNKEGFYDTNQIVIKNESGYMSNYHSETLSFLHVTTNISGSYQEILIPVTGFWTISALSGNMIGTVETKWEYKNNERLFSLMNEVRSIVDSDYGSLYFCNIELETYLKIIYKDILENNQAVTYEIMPIYNTNRIEESEYQEKQEKYELLEECRIDLSDIDGEQLLNKIELLLMSDY